MKSRCILAIALLCVVAGCSDNDDLAWGPNELGSGQTSATHRQLEMGRDLYATYCVGCHGETGDGEGAAARFLDPKPRDFRMGMLKFASVASGDSPRDEDFVKVIKHGLGGTAMPSFALLPDQELDAIVAYIKTFIDPAMRDAPGAALAIGKDPWSDNRQRGISEGRKSYHTLARCWSCHPAYETLADITQFHLEADMQPPSLRPNVLESEIKDSQWGSPIRAPDFLEDRIKTGLQLESLAEVINAGVGGTAMPTWAGALTQKEVWGIAYYVQHLALKRGTSGARPFKAQLEAEYSKEAP